MLQKKYRLKKYSAFIATYKQNNIASDKNIIVYFGKEKTDIAYDTKFAFVVSKKISKRAVVRNRIKRLMRESVYKMIKSSQIENINKYMSVICVAKHPCVNLDINSIDTSLKNLLGLK